MKFIRLLVLVLWALGFASAAFASEVNPSGVVDPLEGVNDPLKRVSDPYPKVAHSYLLKVNGKTKWAHKPRLRLAPASLTKIMTALLTIENTRLDDTVTVSRAASGETGSRLSLRRGERLRVADLLAATLIQSANDACRALAEHVGGSHGRFVGMMNEKADKIGLKNTRFKNACGHDEEGHYSTAEDLSFLAETTMKNEIFAALVSFAGGEITTSDGKRTFKLDNKNELIGRYRGAIGVKTGYTPGAGKCLIALAKKDGVEVLLVLLNAPDRWWSAASMLDKAFEPMHGFEPTRESEPLKTSVRQ